MIYFILITIGVGIFEVKYLVSKKMFRETVVWIIIAVITLALGIYYFSNPFANSFCTIIFDIFGVKY